MVTDNFSDISHENNISEVKVPSQKYKNTSIHADGSDQNQVSELDDGDLYNSFGDFSLVITPVADMGLPKASEPTFSAPSTTQVNANASTPPVSISPPPGSWDGESLGPEATPTVHKTTTQAGQQITRDNYHWGTTLGASAGPITFGFRTSAPSYTVSGEDVQGTFSAFTAQEQAAARAALSQWASLANITFTDIGNSNNATIEFGNYKSTTDNSEAFAFFPTTNNQSASSSEGDVFVNTNYASTTNDAPGTYDYMAFMHEIGHTLGLEHPGNYNAGPSGVPTYQDSAQYIEDTRMYSLMSYFSEGYTGGSFQGTSDETPMLDDIAAIQRLYGSNTKTRTGDTTYGFNSNAGSPFSVTSSSQHVVMCIYDAGGNDTLDFSGYTQNGTINLNAETFCSVGGSTNNVSIAQNTVIENAIGGSGNDTIIGNTANNVLTGGAGADTFTGGGGADIYRDTVADLNKDHITDFIYSDTIDVTNASGPLTNLSYANNILSFTSGGQAVTMTLDNAKGSVQQKADTTGGGGTDIYFSQYPIYPVAVPVHVNDLTYSSTASGDNHFIDYPNFEASFPDLIAAFGTDQNAMANWYSTSEPAEHRVETFDGLDYVASSPDLINAFKSAGSLQAVQDDGASHYISNGLNEGRSTTFNGLDYIASNGDLIKALGVDNDAGAYHYIENGSTEGRSSSFDGLQYVASWNDLIKAIGANEQAGAAHYITDGSKEGRTTTFDGLSYIANYNDLMKIFGSDTDSGAAHYITNGVNEGRKTAFDVTGYMNAHPDLKGQYANNDQFLTAYIKTYATTGSYLT